MLQLRLSTLNQSQHCRLYKAAKSSHRTHSFLPLNTQEENSYAYAYPPEIHPLGSDIYMAIHPTNETLSAGTQGALTLIHEIGHALAKAPA